MIFDPFRNQDRRNIPSNLPPGAVPPGARFDPFGPPDPDNPNRASRIGYIKRNIFKFRLKKTKYIIIIIFIF